MIERIKSTILVVGCQRSGTTLTGQFLGAHERAALIDEFDGLYVWFTAISDNAADHENQTAAILRKSASKYREPADRFMLDGPAPQLSKTVDTLVLKAPNLTYSFRSIAAAQIPAKVVYPVRDPRAVVASMMRQPQIDFVGNQMMRMRGTPEIAALFPAEVQAIEDQSSPLWLRAANVWKIKSGLASSFESAGFPVMQFRYEDLVQDPKRWIAAIADFCDLTGSDAVFSHEQTYVGTGPGGTLRTRPVDQTSINTWSDTLDDVTAREVLAQAQPLAAHHGYE